MAHRTRRLPRSFAAVKCCLLGLVLWLGRCPEIGAVGAGSGGKVIGEEQTLIEIPYHDSACVTARPTPSSTSAGLAGRPVRWAPRSSSVSRRRPGTASWTMPGSWPSPCRTRARSTSGSAITSGRSSVCGRRYRFSKRTAMRAASPRRFPAWLRRIIVRVESAAPSAISIAPPAAPAGAARPVRRSGLPPRRSPGTNRGRRPAPAGRGRDFGGARGSRAFGRAAAGRSAAAPGRLAGRGRGAGTSPQGRARLKQDGGDHGAPKRST